MYSGGSGYFQALNDFFQQPASCFAMQNSNWILVGLDTAYVDFDLDKDQVAWLTRIVNAAGTRKLILFSHHRHLYPIACGVHGRTKIRWFKMAMYACHLN